MASGHGTPRRARARSPLVSAGGACCRFPLPWGFATGHSAVRSDVPRTRDRSQGADGFCRAGHQEVPGLSVTRHKTGAVPFSAFPRETERPRTEREKGGPHPDLRGPGGTLQAHSHPCELWCSVPLGRGFPPLPDSLDVGHLAVRPRTGQEVDQTKEATACSPGGGAPLREGCLCPFGSSPARCSAKGSWSVAGAATQQPGQSSQLTSPGRGPRAGG